MVTNHRENLFWTDDNKVNSDSIIVAKSCQEAIKSVSFLRILHELYVTYLIHFQDVTICDNINFLCYEGLKQFFIHKSVITGYDGIVLVVIKGHFFDLGTIASEVS